VGCGGGGVWGVGNIEPNGCCGGGGVFGGGGGGFGPGGGLTSGTGAISPTCLSELWCTRNPFPLYLEPSSPQQTNKSFSLDLETQMHPHSQGSQPGPEKVLEDFHSFLSSGRLEPGEAGFRKSVFFRGRHRRVRGEPR